MRWSLLAGSMVALWLAAPAADAADADGQFAVKGAGSLTCSELVKAIEGEPQNTFLVAGWLDGYITAANQLSTGVVDHAPWQSVELLLDFLLNHCTSNPDEPVVRVTQYILVAMRPTRLSQRSRIESIPVGDQGNMQISRESLRQAQEQLIARGFLAGGADGIFGPNTAEALGKFQEANQLQVTKLPDQLTLLRLFEDLFNAP